MTDPRPAAPDRGRRGFGALLARSLAKGLLIGIIAMVVLGWVPLVAGALLIKFAGAPPGISRAALLIGFAIYIVIGTIYAAMTDPAPGSRSEPVRSAASASPTELVIWLIAVAILMLVAFAAAGWLIGLF